MPIFLTPLLVVATGLLVEPGASKHFVFFSDKGYPSADLQAAAIHGLAATADPRQVQRRLARRTSPGVFDARDLPVAAGYLDAVRATGVSVHTTTRWLNAASVQATPEQLDVIRGLPFVRNVRPVHAARRPLQSESLIPSDGFSARDLYGAASPQLTQINLPALHAQGFRGSGVIIGILDTGFVTTHAAFNQPGAALRVLGSYDFVNNDANVAIEPQDHPDQHRHGTWILGTMGANWPDVLVGGAPDASFVLCKTEDVAREVIAEEDNFVAGIEFAESFGADLCTASLGYIDWYQQSDLDGRTAITTVAVNVATDNGMFFCSAAGNSGHDGDPGTSTIIAPTDAFRLISCGAVDSNGSIAGFSSSGPTADGRIKPEILARGVDTYTVSSRDGAALGVVSGTSLSTPIVAAALACIIDARPTRSIDAMRHAMLTTGSDYAAVHRPDPVFVRGYGILDAAATAAAPDCPADFNADGFLDFFDADDYVSAFETGLPSADFNADGFADFFDLDEFVAAFESGC
jgi:serine protease AprX